MHFHICTIRNSIASDKSGLMNNAKLNLRRFLPLITVLCLLFLLLLTIGIPPYLRYKKYEKETKLSQSLWLIRRAVDFYLEDLQKPPETLQDLVDAKYLREIPEDPITHSNQTWIVQVQPAPTIDNTEPKIEVHSGALGADPNGKPYNQY